VRRGCGRVASERETEFGYFACASYMSKINLQRGKLPVENRKSREKKRICSEVSVNSPGNPWSQSRRRNGS